MKNIQTSSRIITFMMVIFLSSYNPICAQQQSAADSTLGNIGNSANNKTVSGQSSLAQGDTLHENTAAIGAATSINETNMQQVSTESPVNDTGSINSKEENGGMGKWGLLGLLGLLGLFGLRKPASPESDLYKRESNVTTHH